MYAPSFGDVQPVERESVQAAPDNLSQVNVLVIDDDPLIRWAVGEMLGDLGCQVVQASDARSADAE